VVEDRAACVVQSDTVLICMIYVHVSTDGQWKKNEKKIGKMKSGRNRIPEARGRDWLAGEMLIHRGRW
jgi:hypothetical protein